MHKCRNCGTEFEGKFCYECGTEWKDKKNCPECGTTVGVSMRFCPECGHAFAEEAKSVKQQEGSGEYFEAEKPASVRNMTEPSVTLKKLYSVFRYVSLSVLSLFVVMLPFFYMASIVVEDVSGGMGMEFASVGNVYSMVEDFEGISIALLVFWGIALLYAALTAYMYFSRRRRDSEFTLFGGNTAVSDICALFSPLIYIAFIVISAVAMGRASSINQEIGGGIADVIATGVAPKLILSFAVISFIFSIVATAFRKLASSGYPLLAQSEADIRAARRSEAEALTIEEKPLMYYAFKDIGLRRAKAVLVVCLYSTIIVMFVMLFCTLYSMASANPYIAIIVSASVTAFSVIIAYTYSKSEWSPDDFLSAVKSKKGNGKRGFGFVNVIIMTALSVLYFCIAYSMGENSSIFRGYFVFGGYTVALIAAYVILKLATRWQSRNLAVYLFGQPAPPVGCRPKIEFDAQKELKAYSDYKMAVRTGKRIADSQAAVPAVKLKLVLAAACAVFGAGAVTCPILACSLTDVFSASYISEVREFAEYKNDVIMLCGMPDAICIDSKSNYGVVWSMYYFDCDFKEFIDATGDASYKCTAFQFAESDTNHNYDDFSGGYYKVNSDGNIINDKKENIPILRLGGMLQKVVLDTHRRNTGVPSPKTADNVRLINADFLLGSSSCSSPVYSEIFYTDGSYKYERVNENAFSAVDTDKAGRQVVEFTDGWGSYNASIYVSDTVKKRYTVKDYGNNFSVTCKIKLIGTDNESVKTSIEFSDFKGRAYSNPNDPKEVFLDFLKHLPWYERIPNLAEIYLGSGIDIDFVTVMRFFDKEIYPKLEMVEITKANKNMSMENEIIYNKSKTVVKYVSSGIKGKVTLLQGVKSISDGAFTDCADVTEIVLPDSFKSIPDGAFYNCFGLQKITIPSSVTSIGSYAFENCTNLSSIKIPSNVTEMGSCVFSGCEIMIYCEAKNRPSNWKIDWNVVGSVRAPTIWDCDENPVDENGYAYIVENGLTFRIDSIQRFATVFKCSRDLIGNVEIPESVTLKDKSYYVISISDDAFNGCSITGVEIPFGVISIGDSAFSGCSSLTSITIPNSVTSIGSSAFHNCSSLTSVTISNGVTSIGDSAFIGCSSLTSITIPNSVTSIGFAAFRGCRSLTSVTIPNSVTSIGSSAFHNCSSLTSVTISSSVTSIGYNAFRDCSSLSSIKYNGTKAQWIRVDKAFSWDIDVGDYTVECTDGKLDKNGNDVA